MFTTKPEGGEKITKLGGGVGDAKTPFTERPATYASKSPGRSASKMVPSIIGEDLTIRGNVTSKGEIQVDGEIEGDIVRLASARRQVEGDRWCCGRGCSCARPHRRIGQGLAHYAPGTIPCGRRYLPPEPCHRAGCLFRRKVTTLRQSTRGDQGSGRKWLGELRVPFREFTERGVSRRGGIAKGCRRGSASYRSDAYRQQAWQARRPFARLLSGREKTGQAEVGRPPIALNGNTRRSGWRERPVRSGVSRHSRSALRGPLMSHTGLLNEPSV